MNRQKQQKSSQQNGNPLKTHKLQNSQILQDLIFTADIQNFPNSTANAVPSHLTHNFSSRNNINNFADNNTYTSNQTPTQNHVSDIQQQILRQQQQQLEKAPLRLQETSPTNDISSLVGVLSNLKKVVSSKNSRKVKNQINGISNNNKTQQPQYEINSSFNTQTNKSQNLQQQQAFKSDGNQKDDNEVIQQSNSRFKDNTTQQQKGKDSNNISNELEQKLHQHFNRHLEKSQNHRVIDNDDGEDMRKQMFNFSMGRNQNKLKSKGSQANNNTEGLKDTFNNNFFKSNGNNQSRDELILRQLMTPSQGSQVNNQGQQDQQFLLPIDVNNRSRKQSRQSQIQQPPLTSTNSNRASSQLQKYVSTKKVASMLKQYSRNLNILNSSQQNLIVQDYSAATSTTNKNYKSNQNPHSTNNANNQNVNLMQNLVSQSKLNKLTPILQQPPDSREPQVPKTTNTNQNSQQNGGAGLKNNNNTQYRQFLNAVQQSTTKILQNSQRKSPNGQKMLNKSEVQVRSKNDNNGGGSSSGQSTKNARKSIIDGLIKNIKNLNQSQQDKRVDRQERNVIIRKNSSKSLINRGETPLRHQLNQTQGNFNFKKILDSSSRDNQANISSTQDNNLLNQTQDTNTNLNSEQRSNSTNSGMKFPSYVGKVHSIIKKNRINFNSTGEQSQLQKPSLNITNKKPPQLEITTSNLFTSNLSNAPINRNDFVVKTETTDHTADNLQFQSQAQVITQITQNQQDQLEAHQYLNNQNFTNSSQVDIIESQDINLLQHQQESTPNFNDKQLSVSRTKRPFKQQSTSSNIGNVSGGGGVGIGNGGPNTTTTNHINTASIGGGSLGRKSINISHQYNDSSLFDMNMSLQRQGPSGIGGGFGIGLDQLNNTVSRNINQSNQLFGMNNTTGATGYLNISQLLKMSMLEEDGIEDMHFYQVAINNHKRNLLVKHEQKQLKSKQLQEKKLPKIQLKIEQFSKNDNINNSKIDDSQSERTISSVDADEANLILM